MLVCEHCNKELTHITRIEVFKSIHRLKENKCHINLDRKITGNIFYECSNCEGDVTDVICSDVTITYS